MNIKKVIISMVLFFCYALNYARHYDNSSLYLIDTIDAVIFGEEDTVIITKSDVDRPDLDGSPRSLDREMFKMKLYLDARKYRIFPDEDAIDKHLQTVQREHNLSLRDLEAIFSSGGYTYQEGREQFAIMTTVNSMLDFKIRSRLIVPEKKVLAYYNDHPEIEEAVYCLRRVIIPFSETTSRYKLERELKELVKNGKALTHIAWSNPFWVKHSAIAPDKQFIFSMRLHEISLPHEISEGFELFTLIDKQEERVKPLEKRYREISNLLCGPMYNELLKAYEEELSLLYPVILLNPAISV